jgi:hypothetical protein
MAGLKPGPEPGRRGGLFSVLGEETRTGLEETLPLIEETFPIPARFRRTLGKDVAELSRLLTSARGERSLSYLNQPPLLSAYLRYFLPWNLYRLCRLLPNLDLALAPGDTLIDLGSGPLSFPIGLWLCRRDLRSLPLQFLCLDRSRNALEAGKRLFAALQPPGGDCPWTIRTIHGEINQGPRRREGAALVTALNLYNELSQSVSPGDEAGQRRFAHNQAALLANFAAGGGRLLVVEPGTPPSGHFISLLREALISLGRPPLSPCTHSLACPFPTAKWCHFAFDTEDAPAALRRLSAEAGIPKERASLSFLLAGPRQDKVPPRPAGPETPRAVQTVRVISSPFPAGRGPGQTWGRYVCGEGGMALLRGERPFIEAAESGALLAVSFTGDRDPKSGAPIVIAGGGPLKFSAAFENPEKSQKTVYDFPAGPFSG